MASLGFSLRVAFGMLPKTSKIESIQQELEQEFLKLQQFKESTILKEFNELKEIVESNEFQTTKRNIQGLEFKNTSEFQKEVEYKKLLKNKEIINYFRVIESAEYQRFIEVENSDVLAEYYRLKSYLDSDLHKKILLDFELQLKTEKEKYKTYQLQKKSASVKNQLSVLNSPKLKLMEELEQSGKAAEYQELFDFCNSPQLMEFKTALAQQLQIEKDKLIRYKQLKNYPDVKNFLKSGDNEEIEKSPSVIEFKELEAYVHSTEYKTQLEALEYKNSEQYKKETRLNILAKDKQIATFLKFKSSVSYKSYLAYLDSYEWKQFLELQDYVTSQLYQENLKKATYANSEEYNSEKQFELLRAREDIKFYQKFSQSKPFLLFKKTAESELLNRFLTLKEEVTSEKFTEFKTYMLDKNKWQKTEEFSKETRFGELKNSDDLKWYFSVVNSNKFNELNNWRITFEDDFTSGKVDEEKWMDSYFWGKMLLNDRYVLAGDKHFYTQNKNIELNGTTLKIVTKKEPSRGRVWNPVHGFSEQDFEYTSGMLSTAHSFRQKYGKFEAKIKVDDNYPVYQAFWLKGEKILPEIDVFKFNMDKRNRFQMSNIWGNATEFKKAQRTISKINGSAFTKDFFIYTLEWTTEKLVWKINGVEVFIVTTGIPDEPLYLMLSSGIQQSSDTLQLPATFEIDWVRCYEKV